MECHLFSRCFLSHQGDIAKGDSHGIPLLPEMAGEWGRILWHRSAPVLPQTDSFPFKAPAFSKHQRGGGGAGVLWGPIFHFRLELPRGGCLPRH